MILGGGYEKVIPVIWAGWGGDIALNSLVSNMDVKHGSIISIFCVLSNRSAFKLEPYAVPVQDILVQGNKAKGFESHQQ